MKIIRYLGSGSDQGVNHMIELMLLLLLAAAAIPAALGVAAKPSHRDRRAMPHR